MKTLKFISFTIIFMLVHLTGNCLNNEKKIYYVLDDWVKELNEDSKILIKSFVTIEKINNELESKTNEIKNLPKYRYEIFMFSQSKLNGNLNKLWIINGKIIINDEIITKRQFPNGFTFIINTKPTLIYWHESDYDDINIQVVWEKIKFLK